MGMYTELVCAVELKGDTPQKIIDILNGMLGDEKEPKDDHPLFKTDRWRYLLKMDSYYFSGDTHSVLRFDDISKCYYLTVRCNVKNYSGEIEKFIDWIAPHCVTYDYDNVFIGHTIYEESNRPTLIFINPVKFETV